MARDCPPTWLRWPSRSTCRRPSRAARSSRGTAPARRPRGSGARRRPGSGSRRRARRSRRSPSTSISAVAVEQHVDLLGPRVVVPVGRLPRLEPRLGEALVRGAAELGVEQHADRAAVLRRERLRQFPRADLHGRDRTLRPPGCSRWARGLRSHPSNLIRVMPAKGGAMSPGDAALGHRAGSRAAARARARRHDAALGQPRRVAARARRRRAARAGAVAPHALVAIVVGGVIGNRDARRRRDDRRRRRACPRWCSCAPRSAAAARTSRPRSTSRQCLGWATFELIIIAHRGRARSRTSSSASRRSWAWTLVFGAVAACARADGPGRRRPALPAPLRRLGRARLARLPHLVGVRRRRPRRPLVAAGRGRLLAVGGRRPRRRAHRHVDPARRRLHALHARASAARCRDRARLLRRRRLDVRRSARCSC